MFTELTPISSGGDNLKRVEGDFSTVAGTKTITIDGLSNIEFVLCYYTVSSDNAINTAASNIDGNFVNYPWYAGTAGNNRITAINGNTFDIIWGSANDGWKYIAYGK